MAWALEDVSLRLHPSFYDPVSKSIYVDVEVRYDGEGDFRLADQNIRLYYDADQLELHKDYSRSDLPQDLYSNIRWHEVFEVQTADHVNQLSFDDELGFLSFSIELKEKRIGGITLAGDNTWQRIAVLNFKVEDADALSQIVWSTPEGTNKYATAFVEVMEWIAPFNTEASSVTTYVDASFSAKIDVSPKDMSIYPNPARDLVTLTYEDALETVSDVRITDMTGKLVQMHKIGAGTQEHTIDVSSLSPGTYIIEVIDLITERLITTEQLVKVGR